MRAEMTSHEEREFPSWVLCLLVCTNRISSRRLLPSQRSLSGAWAKSRLLRRRCGTSAAERDPRRESPSTQPGGRSDGQLLRYSLVFDLWPLAFGLGSLVFGSLDL